MFSFKIRQSILFNTVRATPLDNNGMVQFVFLDTVKTGKLTSLGFVAQEVQQLFPELVQQDADGYLYIDYVGLIPVLVESVKEQQEQIDELLELAAKKGLIKAGN
jgi:hypothetical protein